MDALMKEGGDNSVIELHEPQLKVVEYIERTFCSIIESIQTRPCGKPSILLKRIVAVKPRASHGSCSNSLEISDKEVMLSFPGKSANEAWKFACVGKILSEIYAAIKTGDRVTKRDIYYRDPELFKNQAVVDRYVDIVAYTCGVNRSDLNVTASPKGLVAGLNLNGEPYELVPDKSALDLQQLLQSKLAGDDCRWVLVVEKEATFKTLVNNELWLGNNTIGRGLVITGRGYPDLSTRRFLRACANLGQSRTGSNLPIFGLFDSDPDGIKILDVYRHGSKNLAHEHAYHVPEMIWLGIKPSDMFVDGYEDISTLKLTLRDVSEIRSLLGVHGNLDSFAGTAPELRASLQWMKMLNKKAEIQIIEEMSGETIKWLMGKLEKELTSLS